MVGSEWQVVLYGTSWCPGSLFARQLFDQYRVRYRWIDIDQDADAAAYVERVTGGYHSVPTVVFPDGSVMVEPSGMALERKLKSLG